jgi:hypothetical protein
LSVPTNLSKKIALYFGLTAVAAVVMTIAFQMPVPGAGGAMLLALFDAAAIAAGVGYLYGR